MKLFIRWLSRAGCAFSLLFLVVTCTPLETWWISRLESFWTDRIPPVLLVLGADEQSPGFIGYSTYLRVNYAVRFWRMGNIKTFVVSGGPGDKSPGHPPLAWAMRDYLLGHGVPASAIVMETESANTRENFIDSRPLLDATTGEKGFLTSDFHSGRAARVADKLGLHLVPVPIPDAGKRWNQWWERWQLAYDLVDESAKWVWYEWKGWV